MLKFVTLNKNKEDIKKVKALYKSAFPKNERPPFSIILNKAKKGKGIVCAVYNDEQFVGLINVIEGERAAYLGFFAVEENARGKGLGTLILKKVTEKFGGKPVMVLIEKLDPKAENYPQRLKRKDFYLRSGFELCNVKIKDFSLVYDLLSFGGKADAKSYESVMRPYWGKLFFRFIYKEVR